MIPWRWPVSVRPSSSGVWALQTASHGITRAVARGDLEDLVQVARLGLVKAVNAFDPSRGSHFVAFAVPTMMSEVRRHFRDHGWSMHVPRRLKDRHQDVMRATRDVTQSLGRAPTAGQLAAPLGLSRDDVVESLLAAQSYGVHSIDMPMACGGSVARMLADTVGEVDAAFDRIIDREAVRPLLAALPERERTVLYLRFIESLTQSQIARRLGISQMHVSRILERTLAKLRDQLRGVGVGGQRSQHRVLGHRLPGRLQRRITSTTQRLLYPLHQISRTAFDVHH